MFSVSDLLIRSLRVAQEDPIDGQPYGATRHNGYIRCMGEVSACVFAHPTQMIADIDRYLRSDLMRSVCGRLRLFLDAYPDMADNERIHALSRLQPPRRVFFYPFLGSRIQFTDYLFDSEDAKVTVFNARHVFNVDITPYMVDQRREKSEFVSKSGRYAYLTCAYFATHSALTDAEAHSGSKQRTGGSAPDQSPDPRPQRQLQRSPDHVSFIGICGRLAFRAGAK